MRVVAHKDRCVGLDPASPSIRSEFELECRANSPWSHPFNTGISPLQLAIDIPPQEGDALSYVE
jgi:hypothetical protein